MNSTQSTSSAAVSSSRRMFTTRELVIGGMFAALLAVISQLSIRCHLVSDHHPDPGGCLSRFRSWLETWTFRHHHLYSDRAVGLPVFANFSGGFSKLVGVTGGYIWSWPFLAAWQVFIHTLATKPEILFST